MSDCIFCKIAEKQIPTKALYETADIMAFNDIEPKAPVHIVIISKNHIPSINALSEDNALLIGKMVLAAKKLAETQNISETGYKLIMNCGPDAGQSVEHIHLHLLGGKKFTDEV